ncbi:hypothetical protein [Tropicimonas aquimaris]|uniref:Uncharacterized protein n=1 Tax=Tropicimonas aquimaris TaxID=914152 RepID=A0ABW3IT81_9RHOB
MFALPPTLSIRNLPRTLEANVPLKALRDMKNRLVLGAEAPLSDECIYIDPQQVTHAYIANGTSEAPRFRRRHSGLVRDGDWDRSVKLVGDGVKERAVKDHFLNNVCWEETGIIDYLMSDVHRKGSADGFSTVEEIKARYARMDALFEDIRRSGRMKTRAELDSYLRREHGGVYVHIARDGTPLKAGGGTHRLIIAKLLGLRRMPAHLGVIHAEAVRNGLMKDLRAPG